MTSLLLGITTSWRELLSSDVVDKGRQEFLPEKQKTSKRESSGLSREACSGSVASTELSCSRYQYQCPPGFPWRRSPARPPRRSPDFQRSASPKDRYRVNLSRRNN